MATTLLFTDQQRSVLRAVNAQKDQPTAYTAYGHRPAESGLTSLLGFNGERRDPVTGHYLLGNGYRAFNPVLMRFNSPDSLSPFGKGGLNGYAYCVGDPVNRVDPTGHMPALLKSALRFMKIMKPSRRGAVDNGTGVNIRPLESATPITESPLQMENRAFSMMSASMDEVHSVERDIRLFSGDIPQSLQILLLVKQVAAIKAFTQLPKPPSYAMAIAPPPPPPPYDSLQNIRNS